MCESCKFVCRPNKNVRTIESICLYFREPVYEEFVSNGVAVQIVLVGKTKNIQNVITVISNLVFFTDLRQNYSFRLSYDEELNTFEDLGKGDD